MGFFKRGGLKEQVRCLFEADQEQTQMIADLQQEVSSLRGRVKSCENQSLAAMNRCERLETCLHRLEAQVALPSVVDRLPPGNEDAEPLAGRKTCRICKGVGCQSTISSNETILCVACNGYGWIKVTAP